MSIKQIKDCLKKTRYKTASIADKAADTLFFYKKLKLFVYKCKICQDYHLTKFKNYRGVDKTKELELELKIRRALRRRGYANNH